MHLLVVPKKRRFPPRDLTDALSGRGFGRQRGRLWLWNRGVKKFAATRSRHGSQGQVRADWREVSAAIERHPGGVWGQRRTVAQQLLLQSVPEVHRAGVEAWERSDEKKGWRLSKYVLIEQKVGVKKKERQAGETSKPDGWDKNDKKPPCLVSLLSS